MTFLDKLPLGTILIACALLGLAPFTPPHVLEKVQMLFTGTLVKPLDIFDLVFHGLPWMLLVAKLIRMERLRRAESAD